MLKGGSLSLLLLFLLVSVSGQDCKDQQVSGSTQSCQHGSQCQANGTCSECPFGYADGPNCGYHYQNCMCISCNEGYMVNRDATSEVPHYCECNPGWTGINCDMCTSDDFCRSLYPDSLDAGCDISQIAIKEKTYNCNVTDNSFNILFPGSKVTYQINSDKMDISEGSLTFQAWMMWSADNNLHPLYLREAFYCNMSQCSISGSEDKITYECRQGTCACTGIPYISPLIRNLIEKATGRFYIRCNRPLEGVMDCAFFQESFQIYFGEVTSKCVAGECYSTPRPIVEQPFNPTTVIVAGVLCILIVAIVFLSMYMYRKRQQRYFAFSNKTMESFVDLNEAVSFGNDTLFFTDIHYQLSDKPILQSVSGCAKPGEVLAIIGASGAGKTTLLDILAQRTKRGKVKGTITLNGEPLNQTFLRITSYVDQEPAAIGTQTVRELLMTSANLKLPEIFTAEQKKSRIMALVSELGIEHILDRRYGEQGLRGISGGEKRRVQIACQLVTGPSIVFLDEPTSGLDSYNALAVCRFLQSYAKKKSRTVIMSIHQPRSDIFQTFDKLMVLSGGRLIYFGPTSESKAHFTNLGYPCPPDFNPADYILDVSMAQKDSPEILEAEFQKTQHYQALMKDLQEQFTSDYLPTYGSISPTPEKQVQFKKVPKKILPDGFSDRYATSFFTQFVVLSGRSFSDMYRYPLLLRLHLFFSLLSGVLIGLFFLNLTYDFAGTQNRIGMLLFLLIVIAFASMSSIGFLGREREVFVQERASGAYHPLSYYFVKITFDLLPLRILPTFLMGSMVYLMTNLQKDWANYGFFMAVLLLFNVTTTLICISIATGIRNLSLANLISIITLLFFMLFQGLMINFDALPMYLEWMTFLSPFRFALNSLLVNELDGLDIFFDPIEDIEGEWITGRLVLSMFGFKVDWAYSIDIIALGSMTIFWFLVGLVSLVVFVRETR